MNTRMRKLENGFIVVFVVLVGSAYVSMQPPLSKTPLPVLTIKRDTIEQYAVAEGLMVPAHVVSVKSPINGRIGEWYVTTGEHVQKAQPLFKILPNPTPKAYVLAITEQMQANAELESARNTLANVEGLVRQHIMSARHDTYAAAKARVKKAQAKVLQKQQHLSLLRSGEARVGAMHLESVITSPIDGTVLVQKVDKGEIVTSTASSQSATHILSLADLSHFVFKGRINELDAALLRVGMSGHVVVTPFSDRPFEGTLSAVALEPLKPTTSKNASKPPSLENAYEVEMDALHLPKGMVLRSGYSAKVYIVLKQAVNVLCVPQSALYFEQGQPNVLIPDTSVRGFHVQAVTLGLSDGTRAEVRSGLVLGETIVDVSRLKVSEEAL